MRSSCLLCTIIALLALGMIATPTTADQTQISTPDVDWQKCFGGTQFDHPTVIIEGTDGGYIVGGYTNSNDGDVTGYVWSDPYRLSNIWILKVDLDGSIAWQQCLGSESLGPEKWSYNLVSILPSSDDGYVLYGQLIDEESVGSENQILVAKLDRYGDILWQNEFGDSGWNNYGDIISAKDSGYIFWWGQNQFLDSGSVIKLDENGEIVWRSNCFEHHEILSIIPDRNFGYIAISAYRGDIGICRIDDNGNLLWQKCLGGTGFEYPRGIVQTTDGGYIITGLTTSNDGDVTDYHGSSDIWVVKLTSEGNSLCETLSHLPEHFPLPSPSP